MADEDDKSGNTAGDDEANASKAFALFEKSLDQPSSERKAWIRINAENAAIEEKALRYIHHDQDAESEIQTGGALYDSMEEVAIPDQIGAYRVISLIGRGGMGAVYRGERVGDDFQHDVAIKLVRPSLISEKLMTRFQAERQTLASLSHPHIARFHDGGTLENGAPYIIMEFIDGSPITDWSDGRTLSLDQRLSIFKDVCNAVSYAHQNQIIHRDITPSNVLVDKDGHAKLIDFGIAKPAGNKVSRAPNANSLDSLSFTPGYAAPERSKGASANTLSDIYSLGKLLETLTQSFNEKELDAIVSKAAAEDPENRYESVGAFQQDVSSFRDGFPTTAQNGGAIYHAKKFIARHKIATIAGTGAALSLIGAFIVTLHQYSRAETSLALANQRFTETRQLTRFVLDDVAEELRSLPGSLDVQKSLRETANEYLDILAQAAKTDNTILLEYAIAERRVGEISSQAGGQNLGETDEALKHLRKSIELLSPLVTMPDADASVYFALGKAEVGYGYTLGYHLSEWPEANSYIRRSVVNFDRAIDANPNMEEAWLERASAKQLILAFGEASWESSVDQLDRLKKTYSDIQMRFPKSTAVKPARASFLRRSANFKYDRWDATKTFSIPIKDKMIYEQALLDLAESKDLILELVKQDPKNPRHLYQYIWTQEIETIMFGLNRDWEISFEDAIVQLAALRESGIENAARVAIETGPQHQWRRDAADYLITEINRSDLFLERLKPFDGASFSHVEAVYFNYKSRALVEAQLRFDFVAGFENLQKALALALTFAETFPSQKTARLEVASSYLEISELLTAQQVVDGSDQSGIICDSLARAKMSFSSYADTFGRDDIYQSNVDYHAEIDALNDC